MAGFFIFLSLVASAMAWDTKPDCSVKPVSFPFGNVTVLQYPDVPGAHRGLKIHLGSQETQLSVNLATTVNSTFFADGNKVCNNTAPDARQCIFWRGGLFPIENSETWVKEQGTVAYNGSASNEGFDYLHRKDYETMGEDPLSQFPRGWDTLKLAGSGQQQDVEILGYPVSIIDNAAFPFGAGMIGVASNSRFLEAAVAAGVSPSHSWGLDYGLIDGPGEFVLGGFNAAKAKAVSTYADFKQRPVSPDTDIPCPLQVKVAKISMGGKTMSTGKGFTACIEPAVWDLVLPLDVQSAFNDTLKAGKGVDFWEATWEYFRYNSTGNFPMEDVTVELDDGMKVVIPVSEMDQTSQLFNPKGGWNYLSDDHHQTSLGTAGFVNNTEPMPQLGAPFLSQVYLAVNYEKNTFGLAPINRKGSSSAKLEPIGLPDSCSADSVSSASSASSSSSSSSGSSTSTGTIAGAAVGGVVGALLIAGGLFMFLRRRRSQKAAVAAAGATTQSMENKAQYEGRSPSMMVPAPPLYPGSAGISPVDTGAVQMQGGYYYEAASTPAPTPNPAQANRQGHFAELG
ncbi:aspartic peptidase domain-containing protein [Geopyxis carbonaria]|nr:aspartic peptidase domain-containing protein [Geopyxis carbonaria]